MRRLLYIIIALFAAHTAVAQNDDGQVLVYRSTGDINLFFASELDSIVLSCYDSDSVLHEEAVSQVFHTADTTCVVPLCEIDSVAFGSRNEMEMRADARMMTAEDSLWIIRFDGNNIFYKPDTPADILPQKGDKLFYGKQDGLFPNGLIAKVDDVALLNGEYRVAVSPAEISEVFSKLFYAGSVKEESVNVRTRAIDINDFHRELSLDIEPEENISLGGTAGVTVNGRIVSNPMIGYYYMEGDLVIDMEAQASLVVPGGELSYSGFEIQCPLGRYAMVFTPTISMSAFLDINAEVSANLRTARRAVQRFTYVKRAGQKPVFQLSEPQGEDEGTTSQVDLTCDGEIYLGGQLVLDMNVLGELAGGRLKLKAGPSLQSEFGLGLLGRASTAFQPEVYGAAKLSTCVKLCIEGTMYHRESLWGNAEDESTLFSVETPFLERELDLFPQFSHTRAVKDNLADRRDLSMATKSENKILTTVEGGFEIVDSEGIVLDSVFVDSIYADTIKVQGLADTLDIRRFAEKEQLYIRPVFHYAGHTVRADLVSVSGDMFLQPVVAALSNGAVTVMSGLPYTGSAVHDSTLYIAGNYMPIAVRDTVFVQPLLPVVGKYIDEDMEGFLIGTWSGDDSFALTFNEDGTGVMRTNEGLTKALTYTVNAPQSGQICLHMDEGDVTYIFTVKFLTADTLQYYNVNDGKTYILKK